MKKLTVKAHWIWEKSNQKANDFVVFRKRFLLKNPPSRALAYVAAETKYWLYVNGKRAVFEGGLFRESIPGAGYADLVDLAPYLTKGENVLSVLCWFYGNGGRNNTRLSNAGFLFDCEPLALFSGEDFLCLRHPAYYETGEPLPSYLYGGHNVGFNANLDIGNYTQPAFDETAFSPASVFPARLYGDIYERPIPLIQTGSYEKCENVYRKQNTTTAALPYAVQFVPCLTVEASGGEILAIRSDRYCVPGGPGDEQNTYNGHRLEYICKPGLNRFQSDHYLFGEHMILQSDKPLTIHEIGYFPSGYDTAVTGLFECDDELLNALVKKASRTLYACMRDNFMDCPDRERGQWIGDVSVQIPQVMFLLDEKARLLVKKSILDFINLRKGDVLMGNVPGENCCELPSQSLSAISEWGLIAQYYKYTGDISMPALTLEPAIRYLMLWEMGEDGLLLPRSGDWRWFDHLYNIDEPVLENAWYFSALKFAGFVSDLLGITEYNAFLESRIQSIRNNFHRKFYRESRFGGYSSNGVIDDRANAMAVLSGLAPESCYKDIRRVLLGVFNASVYMENYVLMALCEMGYIQDAYHRMMSRYHNFALGQNSTLWEDFFIQGSKNHAWSGAPATVAFRYFLGIDTKDGGKSYTVKPNRELFSHMRGRFTAKNGLIDLSVSPFQEIQITNHSDSECFTE